MPVSLPLDAGRHSLTALAAPVDEGMCTAMTPAPTRILATREVPSTVSCRRHGMHDCHETFNDAELAVHDLEEGANNSSSFRAPTGKYSMPDLPPELPVMLPVGSQDHP